MWRAQAGRSVSVTNDSDSDDWDTNPDYENEVDDKAQLRAARTHGDNVQTKVISDVVKEDVKVKEKTAHYSQKDYSTGFGGKFGVMKDRQDKSAVGWEHDGKTKKHESQVDYSKGFGGKFGVEKDKQDKSALGFDHVGKLAKHESQTDYRLVYNRYIR
jgi:cortactin